MLVLRKKSIACNSIKDVKLFQNMVLGWFLEASLLEQPRFGERIFISLISDQMYVLLKLVSANYQN